MHCSYCDWSEGFKGFTANGWTEITDSMIAPETMPVCISQLDPPIGLTFSGWLIVMLMFYSLLSPTMQLSRGDTFITAWMKDITWMNDIISSSSLLIKLCMLVSLAFDGPKSSPNLITGKSDPKTWVVCLASKSRWSFKRILLLSEW